MNGVDEMIIKTREKPLIILQLEALVRRLPPEHVKLPRIKESLSKRNAGYKGEKAVDYHLEQQPEKDFAILNDLRLQNDDYYYQLDSILINSSFIITLEIKNIAGTLFFDQNFHQLIRTIDGKETAFPDPIVQSQQHVTKLKNWLIKKQFPDIPIIPLVVISNTNTLIRTSPENQRLSDIVININYLPFKILQIQKLYSKQIFNDKDLKKLARQLKKNHTEQFQPVLPRFEINEKEVLKGVICPACKTLGMERIFGSWCCPRCQTKDKDAHILALNDYYLLFGQDITNKQLREHICISSPTLAVRILNSVTHSSSGSTKSKVHKLSLIVKE
ncbi:NERD domain-containing protein [Metabacillus litoralis]|uniref:NERD domain-containing protein n=2 Tax=Metabacillus litoralis TaxID=152268 RepID=A0A5C6VXZ6_9BACI|nr:NERD domain-containing protein [Metabacillus litoralis]